MTIKLNKVWEEIRQEAENLWHTAREDADDYFKYTRKVRDQVLFVNRDGLALNYYTKPIQMPVCESDFIELIDSAAELYPTAVQVDLIVGYGGAPTLRGMQYGNKKFSPCISEANGIIYRL